MKQAKMVACMTAAAILMAVTPNWANAQDTHYWHNQYGPVSMLLSGAVIGSVTDMSGTFYNPGALGYIENPELLLSANAYQLETLKIENGGGEGIDLSSSQFNLLPNMLAGAFRKKWLGQNKLAYSFITRHRFDVNVDGGRTDRFDILPDPGDEEFAGGLRAEVSAKEFWAGLTWARAVTPKVGAGVSTYVSFRSEKGVSETFAQALTDSADISLIYDVDNFSTSVTSLLWKVGIGVNLQPVTLGITLTTPNVRLFGSGEAVFNTTRVRVDTDGDNNPDNAFETNLQQDVSANYKSPFSVGLGAGYFFERTELHFSAEWFNSVDAYDVLELKSFTSQTTGQQVPRELRQKRGSVVNVAAGVKHSFGEKYSGFVSFNTDNSAFSPESDISVSGLDIVHLTGGGTATVGKTNWMLGISYAFGSEQTEQFIDLSPDGGGSVTDPGQKVDLKYSRVTFMIGFRVAL